MDTTTAHLVPPADPLFDDARLAIGGFLARYSGSTRNGYACDLRAWFAWCAQGNLDVFGVRRVHVEVYARWMEEDQHLARATIGRRLSTVVGFYRFAVIDSYLAESPAMHVRRPKIDTESTTLGLDRMELGAFLAQAAAAGPVDHAVACLLGLLGRRVSEACAIDVEHLGSERGPDLHGGGQGRQGRRHSSPASGGTVHRPGRRRTARRPGAALSIGTTPRSPRRHPHRSPCRPTGGDHQAHIAALLTPQLHH